MQFSELGLHPFILKAIEATGYTEATQVQAQAVPAALAGADLLVSSQTGSGKTAAFLLPSLHRLAEPSAVPGNGPRILVLAPTRELAQQVEKAARTYGKELRRLRTASLVGGAPYGPQLKQLAQPVDIVVATPGRLMDHMERGRIDFSRLEVLVLDEADRMLDMGFIDDIEAIVAKTPESRQTLLFSATLDGVVGKLARKLTRDAQRIEVAAAASAKPQIEQRLHFTDDHEHKARLLDHWLRDAELKQAVVFTATKRSAEELTDSLRDQGHSADALHGDMPQNKRNRTIQRLREGRTRVLVATDVAARGIDVAGVTHVINFDAPRQAEDYVHRIGRTGRAGRSGIAVTLVHHREKHLVREIERYTGQSLQAETIPGLEPKARPPRTEQRPRQGYGQGKSWGARKEGGYKKDGYAKPYGERSEGGFKREAKPAGEWQPRSDWNNKPRSDWRDKPYGLSGDAQPRSFDRGNGQPKRAERGGDPARREDSWKSPNNDWSSRGPRKAYAGAKPAAKRSNRWD
ncbi:superfamily II DNA/RNA helicase [Sulfuritortus calidifontis]|uniref:Superfamily II DNA/RNA helicase n=1 Tax=Sulfuritortus calidifontis TaxID=1914471 RepID=A0A4R3JXY8_9PROT|nr:DEAD/DEAH box helicase [Sulfuritortus calidifontis]TCS72137.1 superfamily II DNA/RNA helicase [Sulfuritortus calidifontis]